MKKPTILILILCMVMLAIPADVSAAAKKPANVSISRISTGNSCMEGEVTITWKKTSCTGYEMQYADNSGFTNAVTSTLKGSGSTSRQIKGLVPGKQYWFRTRAYTEEKKKRKNGNWSTVKSITAHKHDVKPGAVEEPKCQIPGTQQYVCPACGFSYSVRLEPLRHCYIDKVTKEADCTHTGERSFTCKFCGDSYTEAIAKNDTHKPKKKGKKTVCSLCGKTLKAGGKPAKNPGKPAETSKKESQKGTEVSEAASTAGRESKEDRTVKARQAAVKWALDIASDNSFHYGKSKWAHHHGCYFCGTNQKKGSAKRRAGASASECAKTYCCNPFVTAAYCHGAGAKEISCRSASKRINLANDSNRALHNRKAFVRVSKPKNITDLKPGDILLTPSHAMLYVGDGNVAHAAHHDNGRKDSYWNSSIKSGPISSVQWKRTSKIYRYIGTGKF